MRYFYTRRHEHENAGNQRSDDMSKPKRSRCKIETEKIVLYVISAIAFLVALGFAAVRTMAYLKIAGLA